MSKDHRENRVQQAHEAFLGSLGFSVLSDHQESRVRQVLLDSMVMLGLLVALAALGLLAARG